MASMTVPNETAGGPARLIKNTDVATTKAWPVEMFIQGGKSGLVLVRAGSNYLTAFVEVFPAGSFIRGEGATITEAEASAWAQYQAGLGCAHEYEARGYTNGAGFCKKCGQFGTGVFTGAQLGQLCAVCEAGTTWCRYSPTASWDPGRAFPHDPDPENAVWFCAGHDPFAQRP